MAFYYNLGLCLCNMKYFWALSSDGVLFLEGVGR